MYPGILLGSAFQHLVKIAAAAAVMSSQATVVGARSFCWAAVRQAIEPVVMVSSRCNSTMVSLWILSFMVIVLRNMWILLISFRGEPSFIWTNSRDLIINLAEIALTDGHFIEYV